MTSQALTKSEKNLKLIEDQKKQYEIHFDIGDILLDEYGVYYKCFGWHKNGAYMAELRQQEDGSHKWDEEKINPKYPESNVKQWEYLRRYAKITYKTDETIEEFENRVKHEAIDYEEDPHVEASSTELTKFDKNYYLMLQKSIIEKKDKFHVMEIILNNKRQEMQSIVQKFEKQLTQVKKVLWTIELYLGIEEEIVQLQKGEHCTPDVPICFRQKVLYMDEEVAVAEHENIDYQGMDFAEIEKFDAWLIKNKNYDKIIPEPKGVVVLRVRRNDKDYQTGRYMTESMLNDKNKVTYILIKNGENIYRIWADIIIHPLLFPSVEEMQELFKTMDEAKWERDKEEAKNKIFSYKQKIILLQGLIERTPIFHPLNHPINLFKPESYEDGSIQFIYDDRLSLPDKRQPYKYWKEKINSQINRGSRIYFCGFRWGDLHDDKYYGYDTAHFNARYDDEPEEGVYTVEDIVERRSSSYNIKCKWKSNSKVRRNWGYEWSDRKNLASFFLRRHSWNVLNYDLMTLEEVDYYINSRAERENYLDVLPMLFRIKTARKEEMKWEQGLIDSLKLEYGLKNETLIVEVIEWWKKKVIWKRPITKEDAKALRMIKSKIKQLISNFKDDETRIRSIRKESDKYQLKIDKFNNEWELKNKKNQEKHEEY